LTPLLCLRWLKPEAAAPTGRPTPYRLVLDWSGRMLERLDLAYQGALGRALGHRKTLIGGILAVALSAVALLPLIGTEFFPPSDESQFIIRVRAPVGTRVEETERIVARMEQIITNTLRPGEFTSIVSTVGVPSGRSGVFSQNTGPHAAQLQVYLSTPDERTRNDREVVAAIRPKFAGQFPGTTYQVQFGGIVSRILNFGAQAPIEVEQLGYDLKDAQAVAREVSRTLQDTHGIADVFISREENYPQFDIAVDREKAASAGLSQRHRPGRAVLAEQQRQRQPRHLHGPSHGEPVQHGRSAG